MIANFIDVSPAMRYMRSLSATAARRAVGRQKGECTWCGQQVPRPRIYWCSNDCQHAFFVRCDPASARNYLINQSAVATKLRWYMGMHRFGHGEIVWMDRPHGSELVVRCVACEELTPSSEVELDHILPVVEGGGLCGPENYRLLCRACHKRVSAEGAKRRAALRKARRATA